MIAKMNKTEISTKILKREKNKVFIMRITLETKQYTSRVRSSFKSNMKKNPWSGSSSRERHRILAAILDFVEGTEKRKKKITRQIPQGQYAYCKYFEIIRAGFF